MAMRIWTMGKKTMPDTAPSQALAPEVPANYLATAPEILGWRIATFAKYELRPAPGIKTPSTDVWRAYVTWCREGNMVPLAMNVFLTAFDTLAAEVGIGRFQNGAHVLYRDLSLKRA